MDAIQLLTKDHREVEEMFAQYEGLGEETANERRTLAERITEALRTHTRIEETSFYPAVRESVADAGDLVEEALEEHAELKDALSELAGMSPGDEGFNDKMHAIMEDVRHHVEEEEGELFPKTREGLAAERLEEIGTEMEQEKENASRGVERRSGPKRSARKSSSGGSHKKTAKKRTHGS
jgi:hemerythrin-like domain-containing protein